MSGLTDRLLSGDIIPTGGGPAICGCGAQQERSGAATCDQCERSGRRPIHPAVSGSRMPDPLAEARQGTLTLDDVHRRLMALGFDPRTIKP